MIAVPRPVIYALALVVMVGAAYTQGRVTGWNRGVAHERTLRDKAIAEALAKQSKAQAQINADALARADQSNTATNATRRAAEAGASEILNVPPRDFASLNSAIAGAALSVWHAAGIEPAGSGGVDPDPVGTEGRVSGAFAA